MISAEQVLLRNTALLRFYYSGIDVDNLSEDEEAKLIAEMDYVLHFTGVLVKTKNK